MLNEPVLDELRNQIAEELALVEASRPDEPVVDSDAGWRPNPVDVNAYKARLLALRGAIDAIAGLHNGSGPAGT